MSTATTYEVTITTDHEIWEWYVTVKKRERHSDGGASIRQIGRKGTLTQWGARRAARDIIHRDRKPPRPKKVTTFRYEVAA